MVRRLTQKDEINLDLLYVQKSGNEKETNVIKVVEALNKGHKLMWVKLT